MLDLSNSENNDGLAFLEVKLNENTFFVQVRNPRRRLYSAFSSIQALEKGAEIDIHCGFRSDHGVKEMLETYATLHFGLNKETTIEFLNENEFDKIVVIDSEEYLDAINEANPTSTVIVEVHTSIERNLEYLSRIKENEVDKFVTVSKYMTGRVRHHLNFELNTEEILRFQNVLDSSIFSPLKSIPVARRLLFGWVR